jgi:hypothetical protein
MKSGGDDNANAKCGDSCMLNTKPVAIATSFGHQAFCMEDWSAIIDPKKQLETELSKLKDKK